MHMHMPMQHTMHMHMPMQHTVPCTCTCQCNTLCTCTCQCNTYTVPCTCISQCNTLCTCTSQCNTDYRLRVGPTLCDDEHYRQAMLPCTNCYDPMQSVHRMMQASTCTSGAIIGGFLQEKKWLKRGVHCSAYPGVGLQYIKGYTFINLRRLHTFQQASKRIRRS